MAGRPPDDLEPRPHTASTRLTDDEKRALVLICDQQGCSQAQLLRRLLQDEIQRVLPDFYAHHLTLPLTEDHLDRLLQKRADQES